MESRTKPPSVVRTVTVDDAVRRFPSLLDRVAAGEAFAIARDGRTIAQLAPAAPRRATLGRLRAVLATATEVDPDFALDLADIRAEQPQVPEDPWRS